MELNFITFAFWAIMSCVTCLPAEQRMVFNRDGSYQFNYNTGVESGRQSRHEIRNADGSVVGHYSYEDPEGHLRVVNYRAGREGFVASGDVSVPGAPKTQFPLEPPPSTNTDTYSTSMEPTTTTSTEAETTDKTNMTENPKEDVPTQAQDESVETGTDESGRKRSDDSPSLYTDEIYNLLPFPAHPFAKRRLEKPEDDIPLVVKAEEREDSTDNPSTTSDPSTVAPATESNPPEHSSEDGEVKKPLSADPMSFIYSVGSPYAPSMVPPSSWGQEPHNVPHGKGVARYYVYVPSHHHYYGNPHLWYGSAVQQPSASVDHAPIHQHAFTSLVSHNQQPYDAAGQNVQVQPQYFYQAAPAGVPVQHPTVWGYSQGSSEDAKPEIKPEEVKVHGPTTKLTYLQPTSVKFIPTEAEKKPVGTENKPVESPVSLSAPISPENESEPVQEDIQAAAPEMPTLNRAVYHRYSFSSPNAAYSYQYQY